MRSFNKLNLMKLYCLFAIMMVLCFSECSSDPKPIHPDWQEKTQQLNATYFDKICGTWHNERIGLTRKLYFDMKLNADGTGSLARTIVSRDSVKVGGEWMLTDWDTTFVDESPLVRKWELVYSAMFGEETPQAYLVVDDNIYRFTSVDDSIMKINIELFDELFRVR